MICDSKDSHKTGKRKIMLFSFSRKYYINSFKTYIYLIMDLCIKWTQFISLVLIFYLYFFKWKNRCISDIKLRLRAQSMEEKLFYMSSFLCVCNTSDQSGWWSFYTYETALHLIRHKTWAPNGNPRLSVVQECEREVNPRSLSCTYVSPDLMCWQALSPYFSILFIPSPFPLFSS